MCGEQTSSFSAMVLITITFDKATQVSAYNNILVEK